MCRHPVQIHIWGCLHGTGHAAQEMDQEHSMSCRAQPLAPSMGSGHTPEAQLILGAGVGQAGRGGAPTCRPRLRAHCRLSPAASGESWPRPPGTAGAAADQGAAAPQASGPGGSGGSLPPLAPPSAQITQSLLLSVHSWGTLLVSLVTLTGHGAQGTLLGLTLQVGHRPKAPRPLLTRGWG